MAPRLYTLCRRYANDDHEAKDMLQDSFERIFSKLDRIPEDCQNIEAWCYTVSRNMLVNRVRKKRIMLIDLDISMLPERAFGSVNAADTPENAEEVLRLLQRLPEQHRTIINLYFIEGYSHAEIANTLGIKDSSSRSRLTRALNRLRESIHKSEIPLSYEQGKI